MQLAGASEILHCSYDSTHSIYMPSLLSFSFVLFHELWCET